MRASSGGMSLVELMVVVGIVGAITTLSLPRYKSFLTSARRGEAKGQLHTIHTLQETYRAEHGGYHSGLEVGYFKDGRKVRCRDDDNTDAELDNKLGFRPQDCDKLRYGYTSSGGDGKAFAPSDAHQRWIYPDCSGIGCVECGEDRGDVLIMSAAAGASQVCRNLTKYCPYGGGTCVTPLVIPPPPCTCSCLWTIGAQQASDPSKHVCQRTSLDRVDRCDYTRGPPGCAGPPCPSPTTRREPYTVWGAKPLYDTSTTPPTEAPRSTNPCGCKGSPDPRPSCGSCNCTSTPANCSTTPTNPATITARATKYPCQNVTENQAVTINCTPTTSPPCTPPYTRATTRPCAYAGTKPITCPNICASSWQVGQWGDCIEVRPGVWEKKRILSRDCANPCPDMDIVDAHGNPVPSCEERRIERISCPPPTPPTCTEGDAAYIGMLVSAAKTACLGTPPDPTKIFVAVPTADPNDNPENYRCTCNTGCAPCGTGLVRTPYTVDPCECISLSAALNCCRFSFLSLDEVRQFVQNDTACAALRGTAHGSTISALQVVRGDFIEGGDSQAIWNVFYNMAGWGTEGANCYSALLNHLVNSDPHHPLLSLDSQAHLFLATEGCTKGVNDYDRNAAPGCPQIQGWP